MSKKLDIYQLSVPRIYNPVGEIQEQEEFRGFACSYCSGNGWTWGHDDEGDVHIDCPVCRGSGILKAVVSTKWVADKQ